MIPWVHIDTAKVPGGGEDLRLMRRGSEFAIMLGASSLMNSRLSGSEEALATLTIERLQEKIKPHILIGGLGMGFTLRAALDVLPSEGRVTVSELVPAVVAWARGPMAEIFGGSMSDPRVGIREVDVRALIRSARATYDAILLDVDNGPEGLTKTANDSLYRAAGLNSARTDLCPGGILAVWSQGPDEHFTRRLDRAGFEVEEVRVRASRSKRGARHVIWLARKAVTSA